MPGLKVFGKWLAVFVIAATAIVGTVFLLQRANGSKKTAGTAAPGVELPSGGAVEQTLAPISIDGILFCMPHSPANIGPDCYMGIQTKDKKNYALVGANGRPVPTDTYTTGNPAHIDGSLVQAPDLKKMLDIDGVIEIR